MASRVMETQLSMHTSMQSCRQNAEMHFAKLKGMKIKAYQSLSSFSMNDSNVRKYAGGTAFVKVKEE